MGKQRSKSTGSAKSSASVPSDTTLLREIIYAFIRSSGAAGVTDEEIALRFGLPGDVERPRRVELVRAHLVTKTAMRRATCSGRTATVWRSRKLGQSHAILPKTGQPGA